jgi:hypothetical protein
MRYSRKNGVVEVADAFEIAQPMDIEESSPTHGTVRQLDAKSLEFDFDGKSLRARLTCRHDLQWRKTPVSDYDNPFLRVGVWLHLTQSGTVTTRFRAAGPSRIVNVNENASTAGDAPEDAGPMATDVRGGMDRRRSERR